MSHTNEYKEGFLSFTKNKGELHNPYPMGTAQFNDFECGWLQAQRRTSVEAIKENERQRKLLMKDEEALGRRQTEETKNAYLRRKG
ncbi:hypothetical protein [Permianibacter aggregans]|uniref:Uncharacterized protein n=1 Tax=Permianibacter aggregans TaxID=1510150 RepID=A0A4R6UP49_9GAMM|nr:hypothetical protein [Permianibacter aggregans]QGX40169.1 hypothetical protein E2H98_11000 [Permianibacter aggregans]TDQ47419.1 hypothetical protein EV696_11011 [Permianibacter aggregans]